MADEKNEGPAPQIEMVRCLSCGAAYPKPTHGGTVRANPGCPDCGYVGWVLASSLTLLERPRSDEDQPRRRSA